MDEILKVAGTVILKKGEGRQRKAGGLWIFDNEIERTELTGENGCLVEVHDFDGFFMGIGFINVNSKIRVRMLTKYAHEVTKELLTEYIVNAVEYRMRTVDMSSCRLIFGEADFLPGITVDKFEDVLVVESLALGIDRLKPLLMEILTKVLKERGIAVRGIYERSDAKVRELEGLPREKGFLTEPFDTMVSITENGVKYRVNIEDGQKTGFFLDQKYNRLAIQRLAKDATVLDCFTHTGSFALNAGIAGAREVLGVDASELAIRQAEENAALNGLSERVKFMVADVFDLLPKMEEEGKNFDLVILDPPAFTKSRTATKQAIKGYREINMRGIKLVKDGGYFATCSCSHFMTPELFTETIAQAARSVHRRLRQVEYRTQAADHPILWAADESYYLKFLIFQVCDEK